MKTVYATLVSALMAGACLMTGAYAAAQTEPSVTLYDQPGYRGGSVTFYRSTDNLQNTGFNDRAMSAQVRGSWRVCEQADLKGRCAVISGNIPDLNAYGVAGMISSLQPLAGDPGIRPIPPQAGVLPAPPYNDRDRYQDYDRRDDRYPDNRYPDNRPGQGGGYDNQDDGVEGRTAVFFPRPTFRGQDIAANRPQAANDYCRRQGLGQAIYADQNERSRRAVDMDGRPVGASAVLRDVLCRK
jgi:hypothetical protein